MGKPPRNGKSCRQKGDRFERELVNMAIERGLTAKRVPLSGATSFAKGDVHITPGFDSTPWPGECKRRKALPQWIIDALGQHKFMAMRADHGECLIVLRASDFLDLMQ